jgi:hypothetical protein
MIVQVENLVEERDNGLSVVRSLMAFFFIKTDDIAAVLDPDFLDFERVRGRIPMLLASISAWPTLASNGSIMRCSRPYAVSSNRHVLPCFGPK